MKIEIWSDVMCPFCYMGKRNLETALKQFVHADKLTIEWKSYQLDDSIPENVNDTYVGYLSKKRNVSEAVGNEMLKGVADSAKLLGLEYNFNQTVMTNSFKAHRLIQFAKTKNKGAAMEEILFKAFFTDGKDVSDIATLTLLATEAGLDVSELDQVFTAAIYADKVISDINEAHHIGVTGVPFFVFDRKYAISGAQSPELMLETISKAYEEWDKETHATLNISNGQSCTIDGHCE